jgi:hypothetical protein
MAQVEVHLTYMLEVPISDLGLVSDYPIEGFHSFS